jgi:hypothetical protein
VRLETKTVTAASPGEGLDFKCLKLKEILALAAHGLDPSQTHALESLPPGWRDTMVLWSFLTH